MPSSPPNSERRRAKPTSTVARPESSRTPPTLLAEPSSIPQMRQTRKRSKAGQSKPTKTARPLVSQGQGLPRLRSESRMLTRSLPRGAHSPFALNTHHPSALTPASGGLVEEHPNSLPVDLQHAADCPQPVAGRWSDEPHFFPTSAASGDVLVQFLMNRLRDWRHRSKRAAGNVARLEVQSPSACLATSVSDSSVFS